MPLIRDLELTRDETLKYFSLGDADLAKTYGPGKWSVRFVLNHIADSEMVMYYRIRRVICEPRQIIWYYDEDAWAKRLDYGEVPLSLPRDIYTSVRAGIIDCAERHYESDGQIPFVHSITGLRTLKDEFDKVDWQNEHHLAQIRKALGS